MSWQNYKNEHSLRMLSSVLKYLYIFQQILCRLKKLSKFFSTHLIREHHDSYLFYNHYMNFESNFADAPFTVVFNPVKNITIGIIPKRKNSRSIGVPIHDVFYFLTFSEKTAEN